MFKIISIIIVSVSLTFADSLSVDSEYKNFTIPQRLGAVGLNYVPLIVAIAIAEDFNPYKAGAPSFVSGKNIGIGLTLFSGVGTWVIMDDILGAAIQGALSGVGFALITYNMFADVDCAEGYTCNSKKGSVYAAATGFYMLIAGQAFGLIYPLLYNKPKSASASKIGDFNIAVLPSKQGDLKTYLMYSKGF